MSNNNRGAKVLPFPQAPAKLEPEEVLARVRKDCHGFLKASDVEALADHNATRLMPALVRCGACRFTCPMQDVAHLIALVETGKDSKYGDRGDYVRDVSLLAGG